MRRENISKAVGGISIRHIQEAAVYNGTQKSAGFPKRMRYRVAAAAAVLVCGITVCMGSPSIAKSWKGFYRNIVRWGGAVTGTEYKNAQDEIKLRASMAAWEDGKLFLSLEIKLLDGSREPYRHMEEIALGDYQILDASGKEIAAAFGQQETAGIIKNGTAVLWQPLDVERFSEGVEYKLVARSVYGLKKADQALKIEGYWECVFKIGDE